MITCLLLLSDLRVLKVYSGLITSSSNTADKELTADDTVLKLERKHFNYISTHKTSHLEIHEFTDLQYVIEQNRV